MKFRFVIVVLLPLFALILQWLLWQWLSPFVWFLFFPTVFICARTAGFSGGIASTLLSTVIVWYFFLPPQLSWKFDQPANASSVILFLVMGYLISKTHQLLFLAQTKTENQLAESETRFESTFEQAAVGIALVSLEGRWLRVNHKICEIVGYTQDELMNLTFQDITHPDDLYMDMDNVRRMLSGEIKTYSLEKRYLRKNNEIVWINLTVALTRKADSTPDYFISVVENIHARKMIEFALKENTDSLREAQRLAGIGNWEWNVVEDVHIWAEELYNIYGRDPKLPPAVYPEVKMYFTPASWDKLSKAVEEGLAESVPYECDAEVVRPDGTRRWIIARGAALKDANDKVIKLYGTVQDITERKLAEKAIRESEERLRLFIGHAPASIAMFDHDMRYLSVSKRWMDDYALGARDIIGCSHYEIFPEIQEGWKSVHRRGLAGEIIRCDEDKFVRQDGSTQWIRWEVRPWRSSDGSIGGIVIFSEDITLYKQAEDDVRKLNENLEQRVAERTAELLAANRELDSFAYAVSHDLRGPLRAMSGFSQALAEDYAEQLHGEGMEFLNQIDIASRKMGELIDGILSLSRSSRGELAHDSIDISLLAEQLLKELAQNEPDRKVEWQVEPNLQVTGDARMIESVVRNLIDNAWKFTRKSALPHIRVYAGTLNDKCSICVEDNGAGFDMAHTERLFRPFQRLHRQEEFPGIGIGLATAQRIINRHGGEISASGSPGAGATFCFAIPIFTRELSK